MFIHKHLRSFKNMLILGALVILPASATAVDIVTPTLVRESMMIPILSDGKTIRLKVRVYRPAHDGIVPTVIFHHGSAKIGGIGTQLFLRPDALIYYFSRRGWAIVMPARRGRSGSEGRYREQPRGTCNGNMNYQTVDWALEEIDQVTTQILDLPFVDPDMIVVAGQSRGGILAILHASMRPTLYQGVVNFAGTWTPQTCIDAKPIHKNLLSRPVEYEKEMLWLYSPGDSLGTERFQQYKLHHFKQAGGSAALVTDFSRTSGHGLLHTLDEWNSVVDAYLQRRNLPHTQSASIVAQITSDGAPIPLDAYLGTWTGKWHNTDPSVLHVGNITPSGQLKGYFQFKRGKKHRFATKLDDRGVLYVGNIPGKVLRGFYLNQHITIEGHFQAPSLFSRAYLTRRQPRASLQSAPTRVLNHVRQRK